MKRWMCGLLFAACAATASAQVGEISVSGGVARFRNNDLNAPDIGTLFNAGQLAVVPTTLQSNFRLGFRLTFNTWRFFGHEIGYAYNHSKIEQSTSGNFNFAEHQGFYDFLAYALPEGSIIRPFAAGGVGFSTFNPPGTSTYSGGGSTKFGFNYGGGVKVKLTHMFGVRADVRDYVCGRPKLYGIDISQPSGLLHQFEVSAGFALLF